MSVYLGGKEPQCSLLLVQMGKISIWHTGVGKKSRKQLRVLGILITGSNSDNGEGDEDKDAARKTLGDRQQKAFCVFYHSLSLEYFHLNTIYKLLFT